MCMSNNGSLVYNDIVKPLKKYKNHVWYDAMSVKDKDGNKTIFRRGDENGI